MPESNETQSKRQVQSLLLGQRLTWASLSLVLGILSFINLFGIEKAILAIVIGRWALKRDTDALPIRRNHARAGVLLGVLNIVGLGIAIVLSMENWDTLMDLYRWGIQIGAGEAQ